MNTFEQKPLIISALVMIIISLSACDKNFEEINTNPEAVSTPTAAFIFSKALYDGASISGNTGHHLFGLMQYTTSYNDVEGFGSKYVASQQNGTSSVFNDAYPAQINEIGEVIKAVKEDATNVNLLGVARIWRVFCFSRITDLYGDLPYTEAGQGFNQALYQPKYDSQSDIYADMLKELDEAAASLDPANGKTFGPADLIYEGDVTKWKKFAYSLMLRLGMRLTKVDEGAAQSWVGKAVSGGVITDFADIAKMNYIGSGQDINKNPVALQLLNDNYIVADGVTNVEGGKYQEIFIDSLKANKDPRLPLLSIVWKDGTPNSDTSIQKGMADNISGTKPSDFGSFSEPNPATILKLSAPLLLFTTAESDFLLAEAALRGWYTSETAAALYEKGVRAAMQQWDLITGITGAVSQVEVDDYLSAHAWLAGGSVELQKQQIYNQFWVGLFPDAQEVYNNYRRTGYPALVPNNYPGNATGAQILRRFLYPISEQTLNTNSYQAAISSQGPDNLMTRIWWDKE